MHAGDAALVLDFFQEANCTAVAAGLSSSVVKTTYIHVPVLHPITKRGKKKNQHDVANYIITVGVMWLKDHLWKANQTGPTTKMPFSSTWQKRATSSQLSETDFNAEHQYVSAPLNSMKLLHTEEAKIK